MKWAFDIDGTIDSNPSFFSWFTYKLRKPDNNNQIYIVTCRNPSRKAETEDQLSRWGIEYDSIIFMPDDCPRDIRSLLDWKIGIISEIDPDIWFDDWIKLYRNLYGVDLRSLFPECEIISL
jgi:hypothetical protein